MSVTDFECAIAKSQIGRYIAGENLAPDIARQLESHINSCARCKQLLQEKKNSLEAMIVDDIDAIKVTSNPTPMTQGSSAMKPDFMEVLADSARKSLREKVGDMPRTISEFVEIPAVSPAFAYKDSTEPETIQMRVETPEKSPKKKGFGLSSLALFKNVPDEAVRPAMTMDNIRAAKAVVRDSNQNMKKPMMYLAGLCAVVAAMSFVLRDPTSLFGGKVSPKTAAVVAPAKKPTAKVAKVLPHKPTQLNDKGTDAQSFVTEPKPKPKLVKKPLAKAKPKPVIKVAKASESTTRKKASTPKLSAKKVAAQHFAKTTKPSATRRAPSSKKKHKSTAETNVVKLYSPDSTPQNQEQK